MSKVHSLKRTQKIPVNLNAAWNFFCKPDNLKKIIPHNIHFTVISPLNSTVIYPGQIIRYKVKTRTGLTMPWVTEITDVQEKEYFIDEQQSGMFKIWRHQHYFIEIPDGVELTDILHYKFRFGLLGNIAHTLFIRKRVKQMFDYRDRKLKDLFGEYIDRQ